MGTTINLGGGVSIFPHHKTWILTVCCRGQRIRRSLGTHDRGEALMIATAFVMKPLETECDLAERVKFAWRLIDFAKLNPDEADTIEATRRAALLTVADKLEMPAAVPAQAAVLGIVRSEIERAMGKKDLPAVTVEAVLTGYLAYQGRVNGKRHAADVESILRMFVDHAKVENVGDVTRAHVEAYLSSLAGLSAKTEKNRKIVVSAWLDWAKNEKHVSENVAQGLKTRKVVKGRVVYHSSEELGRIVEAAKGHPMGPMVVTALYTGMRASELLKMDGEDVDFVGYKVRVKDDTKTGGRDVPLMEQLIPTLMRLPRTGRLFPFKECGAFRRAIVEIWTAAKLKGKTGLQILRHSWVTHLLLSGRSNYDVARWAGHNPMVQEKHYAGYKLGDTPFPMTCAKHGIGKAKKEAKFKG
jgi:integrase